MIGQLLAKVIGTQNDRELKRMRPLVERVNAFEPTVKGLGDADLKARTAAFRTRVGNGEPLDAIFISQIYHDFFLTQLNIDVPALNRQMFEALRPGGVLIIIDHAAPDGAAVGTDGATASHRIDQAQVARELTAAGFVLEEESQVLRNPADDRSMRVFEGDIRGRTDQFVLRFRKPAS